MAITSTQREHFFPQVIRAMRAEVMLTALSTASAARKHGLLAKAEKLKNKASRPQSGFYSR